MLHLFGHVVLPRCRGITITFFIPVENLRLFLLKGERVSRGCSIIERSGLPVLSPGFLGYFFELVLVPHKYFELLLWVDLEFGEGVQIEGVDRILDDVGDAVGGEGQICGDESVNVVLQGVWL